MEDQFISYTENLFLFYNVVVRLLYSKPILPEAKFWI